MKMVLMILSLAFSMNTFASQSETNEKMIEVFKEYKSELKNNKEFRKLIRSGKKSEENREAASAAFLDFFETRGVRFGYFSAHKVSNFAAIVVQKSFIGNKDSDNDFLGYGPGIGASVGYEIIACTLRTDEGLSDNNIGLNVKFVPLVGVWAGLFAGDNGLCVKTGAGVGLEVSAGISKIKG